MSTSRNPPPPWHGWLALGLLPIAVLVVAPATWPRWALMWVLSIALFAGCKWLTWRRRRVIDAPGWLHVAYLFAWPGLDADGFLRSRPGFARHAVPRREWVGAGVKAALGIALFWGAPRLLPADHPLAVGWLGMIGFIFIAHVGLFHLLSCAWRTAGVNARPLMLRPLASQSLAEFWGRRWNTAFRDLTHRFLFRPLTTRFGPRTALVVGFVFSGLVHDLVISVPAGGGYGGPTLYFLLQALAMMLERSRRGRRAGLGAGWRGRGFTVLVLAVPV
ncbi:MAG: membrane bound O-acyl transferase family-domain-containing protein, partial [Phycisphaerae bacterium]|nr:membrane bound O-acyl transferase family-domain-containing protein [Phycisphaerae bacterium]